MESFQLRESGLILVMIALILVASAAVLWFILAVGLGVISYAVQRQQQHATLG